MIPEHNDSDVITEKQAISIIIFGEPASKARQVFIYALVDPRDANVRYIGRSFVPEDRYKRHLIDKSETHKTRWIRQLKSVGLQPELKILDVVSEQQWSDAERQWMSKYKDLTNSCAGGYGILCPSTETRMKMRNKKLGQKQTKEHRARVSAAHKGKKKPPRTADHKAKLSTSGKQVVRTQEWKEKLIKSRMLRKPRSNSGYKGVCFDKRRGTYEAYIQKNSKKVQLGRFSSAVNAALAYNNAAINFGWPIEGLNKL